MLYPQRFNFQSSNKYQVLLIVLLTIFFQKTTQSSKYKQVICYITKHHLATIREELTMLKCKTSKQK